MRDPALAASSVKPRASTSPARSRAIVSTSQSRPQSRGRRLPDSSSYATVWLNRARHESDDQLLAEICGAVHTQDKPRALRRASARGLPADRQERRRDAVADRGHKALRTQPRCRKSCGFRRSSARKTARAMRSRRSSRRSTRTATRRFASRNEAFVCGERSAWWCLAPPSPPRCRASCCAPRHTASCASRSYNIL